MDSFDSYRSSVPARLPANRPGSPALRASSGLPEAASHSPLSIQVVFRGARRYWWLVLMLWIVVSAGLGAAIYLKVKPSYKAYSMLRTEPASAAIFSVATSGEIFDTFMQTQVQLIKSPNVLTAAASNPKAANLKRILEAGDVVQELKKNVDVAISTGTYLIEVSMTSPDPYESAVIVNAVVDSYLETNEQWADGMTRNQIKKLEDYLHELDTKLEDIERRWKELVAKSDTKFNEIARQRKSKDKDNKDAADDSAGSARLATVEQYMDINSQILQIDLKMADAQAALATAKAAANKAVKNTSAAEESERVDKMMQRRFQLDPEVMQLAGEMMAARRKLDDDRRIIKGPGDPAIVRDQKKLDGLKAKYDALWVTKSEVWREEIERGGPNVITPEQEVRELQARVDLLQNQRATYKKTATELELSTSTH